MMDNTKPEATLFFNNYHSRLSIDNLLFDEFRRKNRFIDISIKSSDDNHVIHAHRVYLSAVSPLFNQLLQNENENVIELSDIEGPILKDLIQYLYTGEISLRDKNIEKIYLGATHLELKYLQDKCVEFMKMSIRGFNCFQRRDFSIKNKIKSLTAEIDVFIKKHSTALIDLDSFKNLELNQITSLIDNSEKTFRTESELLRGILNWVQADDTKKREEHILSLLKKVDIYKIPKETIKMFIIEKPILKTNKCENFWKEHSEYLESKSTEEPIKTPSKIKAEISSLKSPEKKNAMKVEAKVEKINEINDNENSNVRRSGRNKVAKSYKLDEEEDVNIRKRGARKKVVASSSSASSSSDSEDEPDPPPKKKLKGRPKIMLKKSGASNNKKKHSPSPSSSSTEMDDEDLTRESSPAASFHSASTVSIDGSVGNNDGKSLNIIFCKKESKNLMTYNIKDNKHTQIFDLNLLHFNNGLIADNKFLFNIGGYYGKERPVICSCYHPLKKSSSNSKWVYGGQIKEARFDFVSLFYKNAFYIMGGQNDNGTLNTVEELIYPDKETGLEIKDQIWEIVGKMCFRRRSFAACIFNDKIFIFGGKGGNNEKDKGTLKEVECFDLKTKSSSFVTKMKIPRFNHRVVVFGEKIFVVGGQTYQEDVKKDLKLVESYNVSTGHWKTEANLNYPRVNGTLLSYNNELYAIGGNLGEKQTMEVYNPTNKKWNFKAIKVPENVDFSSGAFYFE